MSHFKAPTVGEENTERVSPQSTNAGTIATEVCTCNIANSDVQTNNIEEYDQKKCLLHDVAESYEPASNCQDLNETLKTGPSKTSKIPFDPLVPAAMSRPSAAPQILGRSFHTGPSGTTKMAFNLLHPSLRPMERQLLNVESAVNDVMAARMNHARAETELQRAEEKLNAATELLMSRKVVAMQKTLENILAAKALKSAKARKEEVAENLRGAAQRRRDTVASQFQAEVRLRALMAKKENGFQVVPEVVGKTVDGSMMEIPWNQIVFEPTASNESSEKDQAMPDATDNKSIVDVEVKTCAEQTPRMHFAGSQLCKEFHITVIEEPHLSHNDDDPLLDRGMRTMPDTILLQHVDNSVDFDEFDITASMWFRYWGSA
ncbi:hypothetical protein BZA77DRAFT_348578 [Pyronema omphalodes]|nr:hypothetical protein BZA77DRAFT_348578 [Pyronema omphalodes]